MSKQKITDEAFNAFVRAKLDELRAQRENIEARMEALRIALSVATGEPLDSGSNHAKRAKRTRSKSRKRNRPMTSDEITQGIVAAIRAGAHTAPEIAKHSGQDPGNMSKRLTDRASKGIVRRTNGKWVLA